MGADDEPPPSEGTIELQDVHERGHGVGSVLPVIGTDSSVGAGILRSPKVDHDD